MFTFYRLILPHTALSYHNLSFPNPSYITSHHITSPRLTSPHLSSPHPTPQGHEGQVGRPDHATRWLWLVRLCFDRRSTVRTLSIRILGVVLKNTRSVPSVMDRAEERRYDDQTEHLGELSNAIAALSYLVKLYLTLMYTHTNHAKIAIKTNLTPYPSVSRIRVRAEDRGMASFKHPPKHRY
jgi:hypothetical protein